MAACRALVLAALLLAPANGLASLPKRAKAKHQGTFAHHEQPQPAPEQEGSCHTAVSGETCHKDLEVTWAMTKGIVEHKFRYPGLHKTDAFEVFQDFLHKRLPDVCPKACKAEPQSEQGVSEPAQPLQRMEACHTAVVGEGCHKEVLWAMQTGIHENPSWYPGLTSNSSFEDFQTFLHTLDKLRNTCAMPCNDEKIERKEAEQGAEVEKTVALESNDSAAVDDNTIATGTESEQTPPAMHVESALPTLAPGTGAVEPSAPSGGANLMSGQSFEAQKGNKVAEEAAAKADAEEDATFQAAAKVEAAAKEDAESQSAAAAESQAAFETKAKAEAEADAEEDKEFHLAIATEAEAALEAEAKAQAKADAAAKVAAEAMKDAQFKAAAEAEAKAAAKAAADAKADAEADAKEDAEFRSAAAAEAQAALEAQAKAKAKAEAAAKAEAEAKADAEFKAAVDAEAQAAAKAAAGATAKAEVWAEVAAKAKAWAEAAARAKEEADAKAKHQGATAEEDYQISTTPAGAVAEEDYGRGAVSDEDYRTSTTAPGAVPEEDYGRGAVPEEDYKTTTPAPVRALPEEDYEVKEEAKADAEFRAAVEAEAKAFKKRAEARATLVGEAKQGAQVAEEVRALPEERITSRRRRPRRTQSSGPRRRRRRRLPWSAPRPPGRRR
ncbi:unnamed protein product [Prorocentrum cordatum]|uniref:Thiol oxidase n=1 Tax=Prorocentrum cordatum TaxID=2364126 RepID=A0ABN9W626_9DINO|nr:unnamed protein product [Polarella glacialis]